jgi:Neuraminidase-like domain
MKPITFPLRPGDQGMGVVNLQEGLVVLLRRQVIAVDAALRTALLQALAEEGQAQVYKDGTKKTVTIFQEQHHLHTTGEVDEPTAKALNEVLKALGAFDPDASSPKRTVAGQVLQADQTPFECRVILSLESDTGSIRLGEDATDPEGRYAIAYELPAGVDSARLRIAAFAADGQRRAQATLEAAKPVEIVNLRVQGEGTAYRVSGKVVSHARAGVGSLRVVIVDKNIGGDVTVAETTADDSGSYRTTFTYAGQKQKPDLQARAFRGETFLGASEVRYNASNVETLNVLVQEAADTALATEHEALTNDVVAHFTGPLRDLKETDDRQDLTYLANKTGWDARAVALASLADQFSARTTDPAGNPSIHPALFYALFRAGLPANDGALYRTDSTTVEAIWKQGIKQGIVPASLESSIPAALEQFQTAAARQVLDGPGIAGLSSLKEMLAVSLPLPDADEDQRKQQYEQFAKLQIQHQGELVKFWEAVRTTFGEPAEQRLRLDGQLGFLTLNNAPLIAKLHAAAGQTPLTDPVNLVEQGFHQPAKWRELIGNDAIPQEITGKDDEEKRANYAEVLAAQLRLSYPTAVVAAMVKSGETPISNGTADKVHSFLTEHHSRFEIGMQPVEQYVTRNQIQLEPAVQQEITRIQRVWQITPGDGAMNALLQKGVDSAYAVARYDRNEFVKAFKDGVGGEANAALIHAKAQQVHNVALNIAASYLIASNAPGIGVHSPAQIVDPAPNVPANAGDVIAYATLEGLFGEMDYCTCEHCRSILSPAAYLVDLLQFLDRDAVRWQQFLTQWKNDHGNAPYPFADQAAWNAAGQPPNTEITPLEVLLSRRPDIQHLPLTCENTNTPLPYIDLVNETLEYYITHGLELTGYAGHTIDGSATPEELLASPQFVSDTAYETLAGERFPLPLPFHQPLANLRHYFDTFAAPLPKVMEALRTDDAVERANADGYGWRDIWMEELRLSRAEYALLTDRTLTLQQLYGFPPATSEADVLTSLSSAKAFARRLDITYEDLIGMLKTRFINPNGTLIPKLERLGVPLSTLKAFKDGVMTDQQFEGALAPQLDASQYGGDIKAWVKNQANYDKIMSLVVLTDPSGSNEMDNFDKLEFRYADPARLADTVRPFEFVRLLRFIRLWKKLGWSIEQTDNAITALYPADQTPDDADDAVNLQRLDAGFLTLLPRLGVLMRVMDVLSLKPQKDLLPLLACFAPIDTYGALSLYRQLFLSAALLKQDAAFAEDGFGNVMSGSEKLIAHQEALRGALTLTDDEFKRITDALGFDANTPLTVDNVSAIFRRSWLPRKLKLSVQEFLLLTRFTGLDPFNASDLAHPAVLLFLEFVHRLRAAALKPSQALYLIWDQDISGTSAPDDRQINEFVRSLRAGFAAVESDFTVADDPDGQIARARMALVYDNATADLFFGLLNNTLVTEVAYSHGQATLEQPILDAAPGRIAYDDFRKRLLYSGVLTITMCDALKAVNGVTDDFKAAVDSLYAENQKSVAPFFTRYPELQPLYDAYVTSNDPPEKKRSALLENFLPELKRRRKRQQALQAMSAAAKTDVAFASAVLDDATVLHSVADNTHPVLDDLTAMEQSGLSAQFFFRDTATGAVDRASDFEANLAYAATSDNKLPDNGGNPISGLWSGYLETPESGFYNIRIEADAGAAVALMLGDTTVALVQNGNAWGNSTPIELDAGTLYAFTLTIEKVRDTLKVLWQTTGRGWEVIPAPYLYSATRRDHLHQAYGRFFKTASLASALTLTTNEVVYLASHADYQIGGQGWLNSLPVAGSPNAATSIALFKSLGALLDFARMKAELAPNNERLLAVLNHPVAATQNPDGLLFVLTRWEPASVTALLSRFGKANTDLAHPDTFRRVFDAFAWVKALGLPASALISAATNEPTADTVRNLQAALRARYAESDWLNVLKPINDTLRGLQRDALVAYILHQMRSDPTSAHIDTPDKLFEYFLMDVQMEPCMQTSRIRHALSSVQLFIERCLMNLEPRVAPSSIKARQWEWMKRYRVWEANRKVFLWPENWLEPELRDDQSQFFKETMSELLQSDITEDRAAVALLNYLSKLEEVAKLEPCGIHYVENDPGTADDIAHVVARTSGANRKYYYRRRAYGSWTAWEEIKLDIEGNPVLPVVWKNRLFLFWLRILKQAPLNGQKPFARDDKLTSLTTSDIQPATPQVIVQALLCWSEYYNGKWQPARTSDVAHPLGLGEFGANAFDRSQLQLSVLFWTKDAIRIIVSNNIGWGSSFFLYNVHSAPELREEPKERHFAPKRILETTTSSFKITYPNSNIAQAILNNGISDSTIEPHHPIEGNPWDAPFFYQDSRHVFYVTTAERVVRIPQWADFGAVVKPLKPTWDMPPLVVAPVEVIPDAVGPIIRQPGFGVVDPSPLERYVTEDAYIRRGIGSAGTVRFGDKEIGVAGSQMKSIRKR